MELSSAVRGLRCVDCTATFDPAETTHCCPDCGGHLAVEYAVDAVDVSRESFTARRFDGIARFADLLPFPEDRLVTMDEGTTPLVECPRLADELGVGKLYVKDEGANPTASVRDRGLALAVTAAAEHGADEVALPTTGLGGHAAAAYAARAGLDSHAFVPSRATFDAKAMINVHGGEMSVVQGRFDDAVDAFADEAADAYSVASFETPYRVEGQKTVAYEIAEQLDWQAPDAVVYPTGHGVGLVGLATGARELVDFGLLDEHSELYAAQADGCAPIVSAFAEGAASPDAWELPDTICGGLEIADPSGGARIIDALRESDGGAVATPDVDILEAAVSVAQIEGIEMGATSGAAAAGARELAGTGVLGPDDTVVLVNTVAGETEADVLRSHLMSKGI